MRVERNTFYVPAAAPAADPWAWDFLTEGPWPNADWDPSAGDFDLPGAILGGAQPVAVRLHVAGYTPHTHRLNARINGVEVGELSFDGVEAAILAGSVPAGVLVPTGNKLTIDYHPGGTPAAGDGAILLDSLDLAVPVAGPRPRRRPRCRPTTRRCRPARRAVPDRDPLALPRAGRPDRRREGGEPACARWWSTWRTRTTGTAAAWSRPGRCQELIRTAARQSRSLRYVLLVGDDSFDPHDFMGSGAASYVPALFARDTVFGRVPSENAYADLNDDGRPELAIGRLPVTTVAEADLLADKIVAQADLLRPYAATHLFAADNTTTSDATFREEADAAVRARPEGVNPVWSDLATGVAAPGPTCARPGGRRRGFALLRPRRVHRVGRRRPGHGRRGGAEGAAWRPPCCSPGPAWRNGTSTPGAP